MSSNEGKRALVTGATGFIGSHLTRRLQADGWLTHVIVRPKSNADDLRALLGEGRVHVHDGTLANMQDILHETQPRVIFHLATLFLAGYASPDVEPLIASNITFGVQLAEAASTSGFAHFVNAGTAWQHYLDEDYNPVNFYAATKQAFADMLRYYAEVGAFGATTLELFDTYGPNDPRKKLFFMLRMMEEGGSPLRMSPGDQLIDLVYVDDVVEAFLTAALLTPRVPGRPAVYRVSSGSPRPLREVVELWQRISGNKTRIEWGARPHRPREMMRPWCGGEVLPGWSPRVELEEGMRRMEGKQG